MAELDSLRPLRECTLVVPAYNEVERITRCLTSVVNEALPSGWRWREWVVLDGASTDGTVAAVEEWSAKQDNRPITVRSSRQRRGKAADLGDFHGRLLAEGRYDETVIVVDADVTVTAGSLAALLEPLDQDPSVAVAWGVDQPDDCSVGHWASAFQMEATTELARRNGPAAPRAYGRFFAYRASALQGFIWREGSVVDDIQFAVWVQDEHVPVATAWRATVAVTPAGSYRDFYLQTYRFFFAQGIDPPIDEAARLDGHDRIRALITTTARHPMWCVAYVVARAFAVSRHALWPQVFSDQWHRPNSTKVETGAPPSGQIERSTGARVRTALEGLRPIVFPDRERRAYVRKAREQVANWPAVLLKVALGAFGLPTGPILVRTRDGLRLWAPNQLMSRAPLFEVVLDDVYHFDRFPVVGAETPTQVLDVGAHVGSFTCAAALRWPQATFTCVEPNHQALPWLQTNISENGLSDRVQVVEGAAGRETGRGRLILGSEASCISALSSAPDAAGEDVQVFSFSDLLAMTAGPIDVVKLDCEGAEHGLIHGSLDKCWEPVQQVLLEYHPDAGSRWGDLRARLETLGFVLIWHDPHPGEAELGMACFSRQRTAAS